DTMIAVHVLNPTSRSYKLDTLSVEHLNYEMIPIENLIGKGRNQIIMDQVSLDKIASYAAENADITFQLTKLFMSRLKENDLLNFFQRLRYP
ncbi:MAG TPA: DNA polymerase I, partial [Candidatus Marinimicrobia bacterium]|nr:DNA polymerase I [Candidatus Neomarinimicrobiota bacterium]